MFVWLSAFVLPVSLCQSVSHSPGVCVSPCFLGCVCPYACLSLIVCELPSLSAQCALETVDVLCWLGLPCHILSWTVLSGSVCVSPVCVFSSLCLLFLSFSFVRLSFGYSVRSPLFFVPSFVQGVSCSNFSHLNF